MTIKRVVNLLTDCKYAATFGLVVARVFRIGHDLGHRPGRVRYFLDLNIDDAALRRSVRLNVEHYIWKC